MKGVFKCAREDYKKIQECQALKLGPPCTPKKYSRRLKRLSLGMPPCIPFSINNYQFVFRSTIFLSLHALCAMLGASCSQFPFFLSFLQLCLMFITSQNPAFFVWERNTLHFNLEHNIEFSCLSLLCMFLVFQQLLSCLALSFHAYLFKELLFSWLLELSLVIMLMLLREFASVALVNMSMIKMLRA